MAILETVKIDKPGHRLGYVIINKSDFDAKSMRLYQAPVTVRADMIELSEDAPERVYPDIIPEEVRPKRGRPAKAKV